MSRLALRGARSSLRDLAYERLREALIHSEVVPGAKITEEALAEDLGVSRPLVREALQRLEVEGLVERSDNGRMRARSVTVEDVHHLYAVRSALEQLAVEQAAVVLTAAGYGELEDALDRMRRAEAATHPQRVTEGGGDFHGILFRIAANPVNDQAMRLLRGRIDRYRHLSVTARARPRHSVAEHERILAALVAHDVAAAKRHMHDHVEAGRDAVLETLDELASVKGV